MSSKKRDFFIGIFIGALLVMAVFGYLHFMALPGSELSKGPYATP